MMRLSTSPVQSHDDHFDVLVAIDWQNVGRFSAEIPMTSDGLVLGDPDGGDFPEQIGAKGARRADIPFKKMAKEIEGGRPNMIALGAVAGLVGLPEDAVLGVVRDSLAKKGEAARTAQRGLGARRHGSSPPACRPAPAWRRPRARASACGASPATRPPASARCAAASASSPPTRSPRAPRCWEWLAPNLAKLGGVLVQAEDELPR